MGSILRKNRNHNSYYIRFLTNVNELGVVPTKEKPVPMILYGLVLVCFAFIFGYLIGNGSGETRITVTEKISETKIMQQEVVDDIVTPADHDPAQTPSSEALISEPVVEKPAAKSEELPLSEDQDTQTVIEEPVLIEEPAAVFPLNINTAAQAELELLPGIGPSLAERIIAYRQTYGPFVSKEQIMDVKGIGEKKFAQIESLITVGG